jgi:hypothetical protein
VLFLLTLLSWIFGKSVWTHLAFQIGGRRFINTLCFLMELLKGIQGQTGGGGVLLSPDETTEFTLSWGIGDDTNNIVEALALWQGLYQVLAMKVKEVIVFGDSRVIIQALNIHALPHNMRLRDGVTPGCHVTSDPQQHDPPSIASFGALAVFINS